MVIMHSSNLSVFKVGEIDLTKNLKKRGMLLWLKGRQIQRREWIL